VSEVLNLKTTAGRLFTASDVLIICHKNPDGDTLGSAAALQHALMQKGKNCAIICADAILPRYDFLDIRLFNESFEPKYIISVDMADTQLFGDAMIQYADKCDLCIDHHSSNTKYAKALLLQEESSCAEVMLQLLHEMDVEITPLIADCLYTGIATDTGCFKFTNTNAKTHMVAAKLIELGANTIHLNQLLFESKSKSRIELEKLVLSTLEYHFEGRCALVCITQEMLNLSGADIDDIDGITAIPRSIEGVDIGITMRQQAKGVSKVSMRTTSKYNAAEICARLGGGGHKQAAGCEIVGNMENAKAAILAEVSRVINKQ
jgi:Exopolyphosphatase-related proteins